MRSSELSSADLSLLSSTFLFKGVGDTLISIVTDPLCSLSRFSHGEIIFDPRHFHRALAFVLSGRVTVTKETGSKNRLLMSVLKQGDVFGAATLFGEPGGYTATLTAASPARVLFMPDQLLRRLLTLSPAARENYLGYLSDRIRYLSDRIDSLAAQGGPGKLSAWLRTRAEPDGDGWKVDIGSSWSAMASAVGLSRASLYRALGTLEDSGALRRGGRVITIPDIDALR